MHTQTHVNTIFHGSSFHRRITYHYQTLAWFNCACEEPILTRPKKILSNKLPLIFFLGLPQVRETVRVQGSRLSVCLCPHHHLMAYFFNLKLDKPLTWTMKG